jgi:hypothetical protein
MDNYFKMCPAMMSDGRIFTDYRTSTTREQYNKISGGFARDDDYRLYLQSNGSNILNGEWENNKKKYYCFPNVCYHTNPLRSSNALDIKEMRNYTGVRTGKISTAVVKCGVEQDYRNN